MLRSSKYLCICIVRSRYTIDRKLNGVSPCRMNVNDMKRIVDHSRARLFCTMNTVWPLLPRVFLFSFFFFANIWRLKRSVPKEVRRLNCTSKMYRISIDPSRCVSIRKCNRARLIVDLLRWIRDDTFREEFRLLDEIPLRFYFQRTRSRDYKIFFGT